MDFTYERMVSAIRFAKETGKKEQDRLFEAVRAMRFYGFIDERTYDAFLVHWVTEMTAEQKGN